jgi:phosphonate transport system permease protein
MIRTSLFFVFIAILALMNADISISTYDPWQELSKLALGFTKPDFFSLHGMISALGNTISFALIGIVLAVIWGFVLSLFFEKTWVRLFCAFIRAIHELFWAFIFMPMVGLNSLCGILAIAVPYAGVFAKVYAEIRQESDTRPSDALPVQTSAISRFLFTQLPIIYTDLKNYTSYRFECALRSSAILGFIGLPTIGYHLETAFSEGMYGEAAALLYIFYLLIISIKFWAKPKFIAIPVAAAILFTSWNTSFSISNLVRFFTYDILPWPMRAQGYYNGTQTILFQPIEIWIWFKELFTAQIIPGVWHTMVLTQISLVFTALITLTAFVPASRLFFGSWVTKVTHLVLVVIRTTPEYILAYIGLTIAGPSMLPAVVALSLHNGAILAYLTARNVNLLKLNFDTTTGRINRYLYEVLPRSYGQFLAFLFYRWEVIMRESAILGILGITTLGHYIDSAIIKDHLDIALVLIIISALLNMGVDTCSQWIRKKLKISAHVSTSCAA